MALEGKEWWVREETRLEQSVFAKTQWIEAWPCEEGVVGWRGHGYNGAQGVRPKGHGYSEDPVWPQESNTR